MNTRKLSRRRFYLRQISLLFIFFFTISGCGGGDGDTPPSDILETAPGTGIIKGKITMDNAISLGAISAPQFSPMPALGIAVSVEGHENLKSKTDSNGNFIIRNVPEGEHTLIAEVENSEGKHFAVRKTGIVVIAGNATELETLALSETGIIQGTVTLQGLNDHGGILVYVPGTSFIALTDSEGSFTILFVPAGTYSLRTERHGFFSQEISDITVISGEANHLSPLALEPTGEIDVTPPSVTITSPEAGSEIFGEAQVGATISDSTDGVSSFNNVMLSVTLLVDDSPLKTQMSTEGLVVLSFDTSNYIDGPHNITIEVEDAAGNIGNSSIELVINNSVAGVRLSQTPTESDEPKIATSGGNFYSVWYETDNQDGTQYVVFSRSTDGGTTFSNPIRLSASDRQAYLPQILAAGSHVHVLWLERFPVGNLGFTELMYARSSDGGSTLSKPVKVSNIGAFAFDGRVHRFQMLVSGSNVHTSAS